MEQTKEEAWRQELVNDLGNLYSTELLAQRAEMIAGAERGGINPEAAAVIVDYAILNLMAELHKLVRNTANLNVGSTKSFDSDARMRAQSLVRDFLAIQPPTGRGRAVKQYDPAEPKSE
jgi:hypothetical protein